jgi:hypothetical protein
MRRPRPEDFGLTEDEVERLEARHEAICRRLVPLPLVAVVGGCFVGLFAACHDCHVLVVLGLALGMAAAFSSVYSVVGTVAVVVLYQLAARRLSPAYRAATRYREALEEYQAFGNPPAAQG